MPLTPDSIAFNTLLDESLDAIFVIDAGLRFARVSRSGARAANMTPEQMTGCGWRELGLLPSVMEPVEAEWKQILAGGETVHHQIEFGGTVYDYLAIPLRMDGAITGITVVSRDVRVQVQVEGDSARAAIRVSDDGIGTAPGILPGVFERFWQADSTRDRAHGSLGLGLAIVKQLAELHGGSVKAESPGPGRRATFTITLPARAAAAKERSA